MKKGKALDLLLFLFLYILAYGIGYASSFYIGEMLFRLFIFDVVATTAIYLFSLPLHNSSLYDAYWSLTPFVMLTYLLVVSEGLNVYHYLAYASFAYWSNRLTINWIITFGGRKWVDWRYRQYEENNGPFMWQIINFFGIMMMPTLLVFVGFIPLYFAFISPINALSLIGDAIIVLGTTIELIADHQMHSFLRDNRGESVMSQGLWKYSRHPNYLGEISVWVGVYSVLFPAVTSYWYLFGGIFVMLLLFSFISIPLAEKHQMKKRPSYADYRKRTHRLLILPNKKS